MDVKIVFDNNTFLVVDKPSGWIVNECTTTKNQPVLQTWIKETQNFTIAQDDRFRSGIVHRLDKETSGTLIIAKTQESFENLQSQFKQRVVEKTYTALVHGVLVSDKGSVNAPVGRLPWRRDRFGVLPGGREASTSYALMSNFQHPTSNEKFSLLELYPKTGRTHQIRIHMKHIGHPLVADEFYAGRKRARNDRKWCPRLFLHASAIKFNHPTTDKRVEYKSGLASDLHEVITTLIQVN